ncbi:MAG: aminopeptidase, partial [Bryobacteraceae bacterium]
MIRVLILLAAAVLVARAELHSRNPQVEKIVASISEERMRETLKMLESFGTRNVESPLRDRERGIGAAREWIRSQLQSYSPRLEVAFDSYRVKKQQRLTRDVEIANVVAVLPGTLNKDR